MAAFSTDTFDFYYFDWRNHNHLRLLASLTNDILIKKYVTGMFDYLSATPEDELNRAYLVGNKNGDLLGYLNLFCFEYSNRPTFLDVHYAVEKNFRGIRDTSNETIGCKMLRESTNYLLESHKKIEYIEILINSSNKLQSEESQINERSINAALHAGFIKFATDLYRKTEVTEYRMKV